MKGKISYDIESSAYFDSKLLPDEKPIELLPYYELNYQYFLNADNKN